MEFIPFDINFLVISCAKGLFATDLAISLIPLPFCPLFSSQSGSFLLLPLEARDLAFPKRSMFRRALAAALARGLTAFAGLARAGALIGRACTGLPLYVLAIVVPPGRYRAVTRLYFP